MTYLPETHVITRAMAESHAERHYEDLAPSERPADSLQRRAGQRRPSGSLPSSAQVARRLRGARVFGFTARPKRWKQNFAFTFKDWNLWDDMPAWRECTTGKIEDRLLKLADPRAAARVAAY